MREGAWQTAGPGPLAATRTRPIPLQLSGADADHVGTVRDGMDATNSSSNLRGSESTVGKIGSSGMADGARLGGDVSCSNRDRRISSILARAASGDTRHESSP
jgi:hypothetical protein